MDISRENSRNGVCIQDSTGCIHIFLVPIRIFRIPIRIFQPLIRILTFSSTLDLKVFLTYKYIEYSFDNSKKLKWNSKVLKTLQ